MSKVNIVACSYKRGTIDHSLWYDYAAFIQLEMEQKLESYIYPLCCPFNQIRHVMR